MGKWRLVDKPVPLYAPKTIMSWNKSNGQTEWEASGYRAVTPLVALEKHVKGLIELRSREAREALEHAKSLRDEVRRLRSKNWRA